MDIRRLLPIAIAAALAALPAANRAATPASDDAKAACVVMEDGWIRLSPVPQPRMLAGFGRIANHCGEAVAVVGASSQAFAEVTVHETVVVDGVSRMRELERLALPAHGEAVLQPGGLHLMLMQPVRALAEGERVPLLLELADGAQVQVELEVARNAPEGAANEAPAHHHHH
ncbi:copper chaperone PCu(A)C [Pseudoxanthomonas sp. SGT-18]|uniref:copper chaperone PCu(A)C n=1 Tax=Pseudoxanthomonas sp. SGT-18 TaxID=2493087 RepID=UPI000F62B11E|nr:copper chaperone PCu(A)C [Pseudoxanthomonas sp. SGT-18]